MSEEEALKKDSYEEERNPSKYGVSKSVTKEEEEILKGHIDKISEHDHLIASPQESDVDDEENEEKFENRPMNVFQRRRKENNEIYMKTRVKRTYGWIAKCDEEESDASSNGKLDVEKINTDMEYQSNDQPSEEELRDPDKKFENEERKKWREEVARRRQRDLINLIRGETFTPSVEGRKTTKGLIYKRRHVNQLFVRGDNIVMVAFDRPGS